MKGVYRKIAVLVFVALICIPQKVEAESCRSGRIKYLLSSDVINNLGISSRCSNIFDIKPHTKIFFFSSAELYLSLLIFSMPETLSGICIISVLFIFYGFMVNTVTFICYKLLSFIFKKVRKILRYQVGESFRGKIKIFTFTCILITVLMLFLVILNDHGKKIAEIINNPIISVSMLLSPIFLTVDILFKIYKYFKKKTAKL